MSINANYTLSLVENGTLIVSMIPPINISGWSIEYVQTERFGGATARSGTGQGFSGTVTKWAASGYNNVSGINVTNGEQGIFSVSLLPADVSGQNPGTKAYFTARTDSGSVTILSAGYRLAMNQ